MTTAGVAVVARLRQIARRRGLDRIPAHGTRPGAFGRHPIHDANRHAGPTTGTHGPAFVGTGGRLNADVPVTAVASADQVCLRFGNACVALKDILRLDSGKSVPGMLSRHGCTTLFTDEFWNVQYIRTTAGSNGRVSVAARVARPSSALFSPASLTSATKPHACAGSVPASARRNPTLKRRPESVEFPGSRVPRRREQDTAQSGLSRGRVGSELVAVVGGAASAPAADANPRILMMPGGHITANALPTLRRLLRPPPAMARSGLL